MTDFEFGPVELVLAAFDGETPDPGVLDAVAQLVDAGTVRLLDLVFVAREDDGTVHISEIDGSGVGVDIDIDVESLAGSGLASEEDISEIAGGMPHGTSAILLVVELVWARHLASSLAAAGGYVVDSIRIPAPVVNAVVAEAMTA